VNLQDICVNLELAKQLKEAGYPQESLFYWVVYNDDDLDSFMNIVVSKNEIQEIVVPPRYFLAASTSSEIGEKLPIDLILDEGMRFDLNIYRDGGGDWVICYWWDEDSRRLTDLHIENIVDKSLMNGLARMWLYLKQNNLLPESEE
jgi:hypothetical protein